MGIRLRRPGAVCGALFASVAVTLSTAATGAAANQALIIGGISTPSMSDVIMAPLLGGAFKNQQRISVNWPAQAGPMTGKNDLTLGASISQGKTNLTSQINTAVGQLKAGEKVTVVGLSAGSLVVNEVLRDLAANGNAPGKDKITFVVVADSSRQQIIDDNTKYNKKFDYQYRPAPDTKYDVVVVTGEYDGMADFPDRWWNTLAVANAIAGSMFVHVPVMYTDLSKVPAKNVTTSVNSVGGATTKYLVPTEKLPLVQMFPSLAKQEAELKAKIDQGYSRNDAAPVATAKAAVAVAPTTSATSATTVTAPTAGATSAVGARISSAATAKQVTATPAAVESDGSATSGSATRRSAKSSSAQGKTDETVDADLGDVATAGADDGAKPTRSASGVTSGAENGTTSSDSESSTTSSSSGGASDSPE